MNGQDLKKAVMAGHAWLEQHREAINALNVFPVPDGDTGTNMSLTMRAATKDIADSNETSACVIAERISRGALMGARGNSGVILSQILRGLSMGLDAKTTFTAEDFAVAMQDAAKLAYRAVIKPVEGTILTVIRESAAAAQQSAAAAQQSAAAGNDMATLLGDIVTAARGAVAKTPDLLPTLKQAGVVDAGGQGLLTILEGMWRYTRGDSVQLSHREQAEEEAEIRRGNVEIDEEFGYEVVFLLHGENLDVEKIRDTITAMGGVSTVVAGDTKLLKVHTHTPRPGQILDYGVSLGSLQDINIENLQEQSLRYAADSARERGMVASANGASMDQSGGATAATAVASPPTLPTPQREVGDVATVAVVAGDGWTKVYESLGVAAVVPGGQTMNPSTQELLEAVEACPTSKVILLPNNSNVILSARQVPQLTSKQVHVVPSDSLPQGVAALLAFNFEAEYDANCKSMDAALQLVQVAEVTQAVRTVQIDGINVTQGDVIGLVNGRLVTAGADLGSVVLQTLTRMQVDQRELITVYYGADVSAADASQMAQRIKEAFPSQEIEVVHGGQPFYAYIISAE